MKLAILFSVMLVVFGCGHKNDQAANPSNTNGTQQAPTPSATPAPTPAQKYFVQNGHWGGQGISLEVSNPRSTYELPCAHGTIDQPLLLDQFNRFSAKGTMVTGPPRPPGQEVVYPTQFNGTVVGDMMDLQIRYNDGQTDQTQNYRLQYLHNVMMIKCL